MYAFYKTSDTALRCIRLYDSISGRLRLCARAPWLIKLMTLYLYSIDLMSEKYARALANGAESREADE